VTGLLAQVPAERTAAVCGESQAFWICELTMQATGGNEFLARLAGAANVVLRVALIVVLAYLITRLARAAVRRFAMRMEQRINQRLERNQSRGNLPDAEQYRTRRLQRLHAIKGVLQGVAGVFVWAIAILAIIDAFGVSLQPVLAGAGLLGIVVGFGAQQLVRDVLAGIAMLIEDQYGVGDWINVDGEIGQVERVGLRATSFRDLDGVQWHVLNGYIQRVGNLSQEWGRMTFDVPVALDTDVPAAKALISRVAAELVEDPVWSKDIIGPHEIWGVQDFGPDGLKIRVVIPTRPMANWDIKRQMRERISHAFQQAGIRQPGTLTDVGGRPDRHHPVRHATAEAERAARPGRGGPAGPAAGPGPPPSGVRPPTGARTTPAGEDAVRPRDETTELRIMRGRQPRPD
jgi:moderate conductance mechanosensitive channel